MKLLALIAALAISTGARAELVVSPDLPNRKDVAVEIYHDVNSAVTWYPATKKVDDQGHPSVIIMLMYNPNMVEDLHQIVAAEVGRVEFNCEQNLYQIDTIYQLDDEGIAVDEVTKDEKVGWRDVQPNSIMKIVQGKICSK